MATILSASITVRDILSANAKVKGKVTKIYPVVVDEATLPYIYFRRAGMSQNPTKSFGGHPCDTAIIEINCLAEKYGESVEIAEAVREALEAEEALDFSTELPMRSCYLTGAEETFSDDAFIQSLQFTIKI